MTGTAILLLDLLQDIEPIHDRHLDVRDHQVVLAGRETGHGVERAGMRRDGIVPIGENGFHHPAHGLVVVDDQNPLPPARHHARPRLTGRLTVTNVPRPTSLVTSILPPCCSTMVLVIARPKPVPRALVVKNGSKIFSRFSGAMPAPESWKVTFTQPSWSRRFPPPGGRPGHGGAGIEHQVHGDLTDLVAIHPNPRQAGVESRDDLDRVHVGMVRREIDDLLDQGVDVGVLRRGLRHPGITQQILHDILAALAFALDLLDVFEAGVIGIHLVFQVSGVAQDDAQGLLISWATSDERTPREAILFC